MTTILGLLLLIPGFLGCRWWWNIFTANVPAGTRISDSGLETLMAMVFVLFGLTGLALLML